MSSSLGEDGEGWQGRPCGGLWSRSLGCRHASSLDLAGNTPGCKMQTPPPLGPRKLLWKVLHLWCRFSDAGGLVVRGKIAGFRGQGWRGGEAGEVGRSGRGPRPLWSVPCGTSVTAVSEGLLDPPSRAAVTPGPSTSTQAHSGQRPCVGSQGCRPGFCFLGLSFFPSLPTLVMRPRWACVSLQLWGSAP